MSNNFKTNLSNKLGENIEIKYNHPDKLNEEKVEEFYTEMIKLISKFMGRGK